MRQGDQPNRAPPEFEPLRTPALADPDAAEAPPDTVTQTSAAPAHVSRRRRRAIAALGVLALCLAGLAIWTPFAPAPVPMPEVASPLPPIVAEVAAKVPAKLAAPHQAPSVTTEPVALTPEVLRRVSGVPAVIELSSRHHGLDLARAGLSLERKGAGRWEVFTTRSTGKRFPPYAALYVADFRADGELLDLGLVTHQPRKLRGDRARVFIAQPAHRPNHGSFDLVLYRDTERVTYPEVYVDAVTPIDSERFVVEGLSPRTRYSVRVRAKAEGVTPPVLMVVLRTLEHMTMTPDHEPLNQQLLQPGVVTPVTATSRLAFVVPTPPGAPERLVTVEVFKASAAPGDTRDLELDDSDIEPRGHWYTVGQAALRRGDASTADEAFRKCLVEAPAHVGCLKGVLATRKPERR